MKVAIMCCFIFLFACAPELYYPTMQNIPAFQQKGEFIGSACITDFGYDIQAAYAVSNNIGILINHMRYKNDATDDSYKAPSLARGIEVGTGYFTKKNNFVLEAYGFIGTGWVENRQGSLNGLPNQPWGNLSARLYRIALQPSLTYKRKVFEVSLSSRFSHVKYTDISSGTYIFNNIDVANYLREHTNYTFIEPALTIRVGLKNVKIQLQSQRALLLNKVSSANYDYYESAIFLGGFFKF